LADNAVDTAEIADNAVTLAKMDGLARGTLIYGDASGDPAALAVGGADEVLTHDGTDLSWAAASGAVTAVNNATENELVTIGATTTELDSEPNLTWNNLVLAGAVASAEVRLGTGTGLTIVGQSSANGAVAIFGNSDTGFGVDYSVDAIYPYNIASPANRDDAVDLGYSSIRYDDIYATNGTVQTSDADTKNTIAESDLGLDFIKRLSPKSYIFNGKTRTHYGLIAQDIETVLSDIGKPTTGFAGFIKSENKEPDGTVIDPDKTHTYGLRLSEFISPIIKALQEANEKIETLEAKVAVLEG